MANVNFGDLIEVVDAHAQLYEDALSKLETSANSSKISYSETINADNLDTVGIVESSYTVTKYSMGTVSIADATVSTTQVQLTQSLTEMASGIAKNAADHVKGLGRKIGGG